LFQNRPIIRASQVYFYTDIVSRQIKATIQINKSIKGTGRNFNTGLALNCSATFISYFSNNIILIIFPGFIGLKFNVYITLSISNGFTFSYDKPALYCNRIA